MMWQDFAAAIALVLVIEGMLPFVSPVGLRRAWESMARLGDVQLRVAGLTSMLLGLLLLFFVKH